MTLTLTVTSYQESGQTIPGKEGQPSTTSAVVNIRANGQGVVLNLMNQDAASFPVATYGYGKTITVTV